MAIVTHPANDAYRDNFEATFGPKPKRVNECRVYNTTCPTPDLCQLHDPNAPCVAGEMNKPDTGERFTIEELKAKLEENDAP